MTTSQSLDQLEKQAWHLVDSIRKGSEKPEEQYRKASHLALQFQKHFLKEPHKVTNRMREVYAALKEKPLAPMTRWTSKPTLYKDPYQLLPERAVHAGTAAMMGEKPHQYLREKLFDPQRDHWMNGMCQTCAEKLLPELFFHVMEMFILEMKSQRQQLKQWFKQRSISDLDYRSLIKIMEHTMQKAAEMLERAKRNGARMEDIQNVFRLTIELMNEILYRYVTTEELKRSIGGRA